MSGKKWEDVLRRGKELVRWMAVLAVYFAGVSCCGKIGEDQAAAVFFSAQHLSWAQAGEILQKEASAEESTDVCFFQYCQITVVTEPEYGRSTKLPAGEILGDASVYDWRIQGFSEEDKEGCVIDKHTAEELFGSAGCEGRWIEYGDRQYRVSLVIPWKQKLMLIHPRDEENACAGVYIRRKRGEAQENTVEKFLMKYGLSGNRRTEHPAQRAAFAALWLFPAGCYFSVFLWAYRQRRKESPLLWEGICLLMAGIAVVLLWKNVRIPEEWLPGSWSDFRFWEERFREIREERRLFLMMPGTVSDAENVILAHHSMAFSLTSWVLFLFFRKKKET